MHLPFVRVAWLAALLVLAACAGATTRAAAPDATASEASEPRYGEAPVLLLVSIDGLRADIPGTGRMPALDALFEEGARAAWLNPSFPTLTFPNHYTLVTGLRPDRHGIVHNKFDDATLGYFESKQASGRDGRFWSGEPIWITAQRAGLPTATMFWPGSEAEIAGGRPTHWHGFDGALPPGERVARVLAWLDLPAARRPRFITLYLEQVDVASHNSGTFSPQAFDAMRAVDDALAALLRGLDARGLRDAVNLVVLSDHGMADVPRDNAQYLDEALPREAFSFAWLGPVAGVTPAPGREEEVERALLRRHAHYECWKKGALPPRWHYGRHPRVPPILCQADTGWRIQLKSQPFPPQPVKGEHGFVPEDPRMRAFFVARGPDFVPGARLPAFDNVDVYPLLAHLLRIAPQPNDGSLAPLRPALKPRTGAVH